MSSQTIPEPKPEFALVRVSVKPDGCFGVLLQNGDPFAVTLEHVYADDSGLSVKIPAGVWLCQSTWFMHGGYRTFEVTGVPGHTRLLFHIGNVPEDSEGCVLVGSMFGKPLGVPGLLCSKAAFADFMERLAGRKEFLLEVRQ